jgi:hypothetical protein
MVWPRGKDPIASLLDDPIFEFSIFAFIREEKQFVSLLYRSGLIATRKATRNPPFGAAPLVFASLGGLVLVFVAGFYLV